MRVVVTIPDHGTAEIVATDGARLTLVAQTSAPPGASLSCSIEGTPLPFKVKVSACRRTEGDAAGAFRIEGRFVDLTREQRAALASLAHGSS